MTPRSTCTPTGLSGPMPGQIGDPEGRALACAVQCLRTLSTCEPPELAYALAPIKVATRNTARATHQTSGALRWRLASGFEGVRELPSRASFGGLGIRESPAQRFPVDRRAHLSTKLAGPRSMLYGWGEPRSSCIDESTRRIHNKSITLTSPSFLDAEERRCPPHAPRARLRSCACASQAKWPAPRRSGCDRRR